MNQVSTMHNEKHPKQEFQVERLAFFSDAVFAIAITLLVIEIKVPHATKDTTYIELWHELKEMKFQFFALIISFAIIANYWVKHHMLFKYIHDYNNEVLRLNLLTLLPIIFFPFTTAFVYENITYAEVLVLPLRLFIINNMLASFALYFLFWQVTQKHPHVSYPMEEEDKKIFSHKLILTGITFTLVLLLTFIAPLEYAFIGILPLAFLNIRKKFFKKKK